MVDSHICGLYFLEKSSSRSGRRRPLRKYLPQLSLSAHAQIIGTTSRTVLTQTFVNPTQNAPIPELKYTFPLYDGVSVVGFVCTINKDRVIRGVVQERDEARRTFKAAVDRGETAGLLEQLPKASDVFTTTIGNVPAGAEIKVNITYLGELKHDAETDGIRFTIPTSIAPRYGSYPGVPLTANPPISGSGIEIVVDAEMPNGSNIKTVQSPSHPIAVTIGNTSVSPNADMSLQKASATLSLGSAELDTDFIVHIVATNTSNPVAVLEMHPTIPNQRALMATLVPKFNLPSTRPEIVFVCDRSGSMGPNISNLKQALHIFLKSLPLGVKFNICSFGSNYEFLFKDGSRSYDAASLKEATRYVDTFAANFGGTEMYKPVEDTFKKRFKDMELEVFLLTDGEIWGQDSLFNLINTHVAASKGNTRVFTLGIGNDVSHSLIEGIARAGNGFAQTVTSNEKMNSKVVRMLKASLSPHVKDYTLEIKYRNEQPDGSDTEDDDFEMIDKVMDSLAIEVLNKPEKPAVTASVPRKPISLFDPSADQDVEMADASLDQSAGGKYSHVPHVAEPKLLQAPFDIPPLYPFSRTTVYLLLSAETSQRTPKSVVLRGTSAHGPLELEIPVTVLPQKGETIHQLAARKATKELEEGRGWIFHAKDAKEPTKLLKDKFQGRFSDMVEREAVRLGVAFQVGGKWCSFVAVEENASNEGQKVGQQQEEEVPSYDGDDAHVAMAAFAPSTVFFGSGGRGGKAKRMMMAGGHPSASVSRARHRAPDFRSADISDGGHGGHGSHRYVESDDSDDGMGFGLFDDGPSIHANTMSRGPGPALFARAAPPPAPSRKSPSTPDSDNAPVIGYYQSPTFERTARKTSSSALMSHGPSPTIQFHLDDSNSPKAAPRKGDTFETIVTLQLFTGSWEWNDELLELLQLDGAVLARKIAALNGQFVAAGVFKTGTHLLATALVLAFLEKTMAGRRDEWEMLAEKASEWVAGELGGAMSAGEFVEMVKGLI